MTISNTQSMPDDVQAVFDAWPDAVRQRLLHIRNLVMGIAADSNEIGPIAECLKWGEPAWLTEKSGSGTTIRVGYKNKMPDRAWIFVNCKSSLISDYKDRFGDLLEYDGKRAVALPLNAMPNDDILTACLSMALLYHHNKKRGH